MTVYVLIPVFNRLAHTQKVLEALRKQSIYQFFKIIIINDGSTDGTQDFLSQQTDVVSLPGDGNLWWGGAIQKGLEYIFSHQIGDEDYVLFINNDTWFSPDFVQTLIDVSREYDGAAVGSVVHEENRSPSLTSIGPRIDINRFAVWDVVAQLSPEEVDAPQAVYEVDALSGRGTLYPAGLFRRFGGLRPRLLPHYMADYEIAMRFKRGGVALLASTKAVVFSPPVYGNDISSMGWWERCFSRRSAGNIIYKMTFYMLIGTPLQRVTAPLRGILLVLIRGYIRWKRGI